MADSSYRKRLKEEIDLQTRGWKLAVPALVVHRKAL